MANTYIELMKPTKITTGWELEIELVPDLGAYKELEVQFAVVNAGSGTGGETLVLTHSATKYGKYLAISGSSITIDSTAADSHKSVAHFLRFIGARAQGTVTGSPVVGIQIIAKD